MNTSEYQLEKERSWDQFFLGLAKYISSRSKDPSTRCGAVVTRDRRILSLGFNGLPQRIPGVVEGSILNERTRKLHCILHAEDNALLFAQTNLTEATIYTWPFPPCAQCTSKIIQAGIARVVAPRPEPGLAERWEESLSLARELMNLAGVKFVQVELDNEPNEPSELNEQ